MSLELILIIDVDNGTAGEIDALRRRLALELRDLDADPRPARSDDLPPGAKAGDIITLGAISLAMLPALAPRLVEFLQSWLLRQDNQTVKIKYTLKDRSLEIEHPRALPREELTQLIQTVSNALRENAGDETAVEEE